MIWFHCVYSYSFVDRFFFADVGFAKKSNGKSVGTSAATLAPLIVIIVILLAAVAFLTYRRLQLKRQNACSKRDTIGLVTYDPDTPDDHAGW